MNISEKELEMLIEAVGSMKGCTSGSDDERAWEQLEAKLKPHETTGLRVFTCVDFDGDFPVGVAAVVVAASEDEARALLSAKVKGVGEIDEIPLTTVGVDDGPQAFVLCNGDY